MKERFIYIDIFRGLCMFVVIFYYFLLDILKPLY